MNPQLIADLEAARALIDSPEKWGKGAQVRSGGCNCIYTALRCGMFRAVKCLDALGFAGATSISDVWKWNDAPERTHAEVLELFDRAIANERSKA